MVVLGAMPWDGAGGFAARAASALMLQPAGAAPVLPISIDPWIAVAVAVGIAGFDLSRRHLPGWIVAAVEAVRAPPTRVLQLMQSGLVTDYVAWMAVGMAVLASAFVLF